MKLVSSVTLNDFCRGSDAWCPQKSSTNAAIVSRTAADSVEFIIKFLELYPVYAKTPFYIAGESYAGKTSLLVTFQFQTRTFGVV